MFERRRGFRLARRTLKSLCAIEAHLAEQNGYLRRLADHIAPDHTATPAPTGASVDYLNPHEAIAVQAYIEKTARDTGRVPTEEEILRYLADEATIDLQARMEEGR